MGMHGYARSFASLVIPLALVACGNGGSGGPDAGPPSDGPTQAPDFSVADSRITVTVHVGFDYANLAGVFADGPPLTHHVPAETEGSCRVIRYTPASCDPACTGDESCVAGACTAPPSRRDRGTLAWTWPDGARSVEADGVLAYYAEGGATQHGTTSITVDGLELALPTATQPIHDGDWAQDIEGRGPGADVALRWTNPVEGARVRLHMTDCTGSHGGLAEAELECEGPDTGELVIPGAFLDVMTNADWTRGECGSHTFQRYHRAVAPAESTRFETIGDGGFFWRPDFS
ncbi:MAG TPA: hypothetical protein VML75_03560 [Kofleriaceae bacterium]|nr:hypothetical protein [Kofleriaceae bacterium]